MYSLTATVSTILDTSVSPSSIGIKWCDKYHVHSVSGTSLVFIEGITGSDSTNSAHWASIAPGTSVTFESRSGISKVLAKSASTATLNAFPVASVSR